MKRMNKIIFMMTLFLAVNLLALAQGTDDALLMDLDEPSWIYKGRGDRYFRYGDFGNAIVQYKKALVKRDMEYNFTRLDGLDVQKGLERNKQNLENYERLLYLFRNSYREYIDIIRQSVNEGRYTYALDLTRAMRQDAREIAANEVEQESEALEDAIVIRDEESWDYLLQNLSTALNRVIGSLDQLPVDYGAGNRNKSEPKLVLDMKGEGVYPEVNLKLAQIYSREGLFDLALMQLQNVEEGEKNLQVPDHIFDAMYTRADIYKSMNNMTLYLDELDQIIEMDNNWEGGGNFKGYKERPLHKIPDSAVDQLSEDDAGRVKFGRAYFDYGVEKYNNGNCEKAEPYLKMSFLYRYEREKSRDYLLQCYSLSYKKAETRRILELEESQR
jgi:hypothetical protein